MDHKKSYGLVDKNSNNTSLLLKKFFLKTLSLPFPPLPLSRGGDNDQFYTDNVQVFSFSPKVPVEFHNPISNSWGQMLIYIYLYFFHIIVCSHIVEPFLVLLEGGRWEVSQSVVH